MMVAMGEEGGPWAFEMPKWLLTTAMVVVSVFLNPVMRFESTK